MFNSGILDTVIGVIVIFLQLSLVCTAVNEFVAMCLKKRAKELEKGIRTLLTSPELVDKFYAHPLIMGLRPDQRKPSYIPSRTFALALMDIVRRHSFDGAVTAATQAVSDKEKERASAQAAVDAAITALQSAHAIRTAAATALASATPADLVAATKAAEDAAKQEDAARIAKDDADAKLTAATTAKTNAEQFLIQVTTDAKAAKDAEAAAQTAEAAASKNPKDADLQKAAADARQKANDAADKLAPSASSLLTEARDKLAGVQSDVVPLELKTALLALLDNAGANLNKAQANLEQWFDDAMDRVSGVYKRKSQIFIGVIAVIVTLLANVDTLQVANSLSHDKAVRDSLVAAAPELARKDPSASTTPEPSITSIKASLNELNKLGLPIGYVRVCSRLEESAVDSCATAAKEAKAKLDTSQTNSENAEKALKAAEDSVKKAEKNLTDSNDAAKATNQAALEKAKADFETAKATRDSAVTELTNAQSVHAKALITKCPKCQKESALTDDELKRRLPTTHDYQLISRDFFRAVGALLGDSWNLLYSHWFGWLITAFAISLGAPFWFDTLNRVMVIRSTVKPHEKSKEQESKDNPDEDDKKKKT